jgi:methyl-accepting chemotaxis protein
VEHANLHSMGTTIDPKSAERTAESIKIIAKNIRDGSTNFKETVRTLRESGAIEEITQAVLEASIAARDIAKEINDAARDIKERGIIKDTAAAIEEITITTRETAETVKDTARHAAESAPQTSEKVKEAGKVRSKTRTRITKDS